MTLYSGLLLLIHWLIAFIVNPDSKNKSFRAFRRKAATTADTLVLVTESRPCYIRQRKKPQWVVDKVIYLKAVNPVFGCRKIAELFDRLHSASDNMTVGKSYVCSVLKKHHYEVQVLRRQIKHRRPRRLKKNICWGLDLTTVTDAKGVAQTVFAMVDYGSRRCLCLHQIESKSSRVLLSCLVLAIARYGKPKTVKTDNEVVFTSLLFRAALALAGIRHQRTDVASPWQNGRIERMIDTFKERVRQVMVQDRKQLVELLAEFRFWYNVVRPHSYLDGHTPVEVWNNVDTFRAGYKRAIRYDKWEGLLADYYLINSPNTITGSTTGRSSVHRTARPEDGKPGFSSRNSGKSRVRNQKNLIIKEQNRIF